MADGVNMIELDGIITCPQCGFAKSEQIPPHWTINATMLLVLLLLPGTLVALAVGARKINDG